MGEFKGSLGIYLLLLHSLLATAPTAVGTCECKVEGCQLMTDVEFNNSEYSERSKSITGEPRNLQVITYNVTHLNISWQKPTLSDDLKGFKLEVSKVTPAGLKLLHSYNLIANGSSPASWLFDCINLTSTFDTFKRQYRIMLHPLPFPAKSLSTVNSRYVDIQIPSPKWQGQTTSSNWYLGYSVWSKPNTKGHSTMHIHIPPQRDKDQNPFLFTSPTFKICRCGPSGCVTRESRINCANSGSKQIPCMGFDNGTYSCKTEKFENGCYGIIGRVTEKGYREGKCKRRSSYTSCIVSVMERVSVGEGDCCWQDCSPATTTAPFIIEDISSATTNASIITVNEGAEGSRGMIPNTQPASETSWILPVSAIVVITVILCIFIIILGIYFRHKRYREKEMPEVVILYSDAHELHVKVLEQLAMFLTKQCHMNASFYRNSYDTSITNEANWCLEKIRSTKNLVFVSSPEAWHKYSNQPNGKQVTSKGGGSAEAFQFLQRQLSEKPNQAQKIFVVCFPYTEKFFHKKLCLHESQIDLNLMDQFQELCLQLHDVPSIEAAKKKGIPVFDSHNYQHTEEGAALREAIVRAKEVERHWKTGVASWIEQNINWVAPNSITTDGLSETEVKQWLPTNGKHAKLKPPDDISEASSQKEGGYYSNEHEMEPILPYENPPNHYVPISKEQLDSGTGNFDSGIENRNSLPIFGDLELEEILGDNYQHTEEGTALLEAIDWAKEFVPQILDGNMNKEGLLRLYLLYRNNNLEAPMSIITDGTSDIEIKDWVPLVGNRAKLKNAIPPTDDISEASSEQEGGYYSNEHKMEAILPNGNYPNLYAPISNEQLDSGNGNFDSGIENRDSLPIFGDHELTEIPVELPISSEIATDGSHPTDNFPISPPVVLPGFHGYDQDVVVPGDKSMNHRHFIPPESLSDNNSCSLSDDQSICGVKFEMDSVSLGRVSIDSRPSSA